MKKYEVYVNEKSYGRVDVYAESPEEALLLADEGYHNGDTIWGKCDYRTFLPEETANFRRNL